MVELLSKGWQKLSTITSRSIFDCCSSDHHFKELSLKNNLECVMGILGIWVICLCLLSLIFVIRNIILICLIDLDVNVLWSLSINFVKLRLVFGAQESEVILLSHVVNSVELSNSGVGTDQLGVSQESPDLSEGHGEGLVTFVGFNLA